MPWANADRTHPCSICSKADWCRYEADAGITDCYRACGVGGVQKQDKLGQVFWRHFASGSPSGSHASPGSSATEVRADLPVKVAYEHERADAATLAEVYGDLIAALPLYDRHRDHLRAVRKLTDEEVATLGYRSFPDREDARRIIDALLAKHAATKLLTVPGFDRPERRVEKVDEATGQTVKVDATEMRLSGAPGILLPQRDAEGRVVGMMLRLDEQPNPDPKLKVRRYLPLTSYTFTGCAAAIGVHVPLHGADMAPNGVRVVEGIIKADISTLRTGIITLGIQSGGRWEQGVRTAEQLGAAGLLLSPDADTRTNAGICATLTFAANGLASKGTEFDLEVWPPQAGKGLDDVINAGKGGDISVVTGPDRWRTLNAWLASSKAPRDPRVEARVALDGVVERVTADALSAFKPGVADAVACLEPGTVEVQRLLEQLKEHLSGSWGDFQRKLKEARARRAKVQRVQELKQVVQSGKHVFKRGDQVEARDALLDELTPVGGSGFDHTLCVYDAGAMHKFADGIYTKLDEAGLVTTVTTFAGSPLVNGRVLNVSNAFAKGAVELAYSKSAKPGFFHDAPHGVALRDVFLVVEPTKRQIREESLRREHRVRSRYPFEYVKGITPTKFLALLDEALDGKDDKAEIIRVIRQFTGASIAGVAPRFQRALIFRGRGNDAKSTIAAILSAAMPTGAVSAVPPQSFGHPYSRAMLDGELLNCVSETPENDILDAGPLKAVITGDPMEARNPYERPFTLVPRAGLLLVLNNIFKVKDVSRAFRRRWIIIDFEKQVVNVDRFKVDQILDEVPAIVSWAIAGLRDLLADDYAIPPSSEAAVDDWLGECDTVRQYVDACLVALTPTEKADTKIAWQKGDAIYAEYKAWVRDNGHGQPLTSIRFLKRLKAHLGMAKTEGHRNDGNYYPVRLREFALMLKEAAENECISLGALDLPEPPEPPPNAKSGGAADAPSAVLDPTLPQGDYAAEVLRLRHSTGELLLNLLGGVERAASSQVICTTQHRGEDLEAYVDSITDDACITLATFEQRHVEGNVLAVVVGLRPPLATPASGVHPGPVWGWAAYHRSGADEWRDALEDVA